jgi:hypothetical protein
MFDAPIHQRLQAATSGNADAVWSGRRTRFCDPREEYFPRPHRREKAHAASGNCAPANDRVPDSTKRKSPTDRSLSPRNPVGTSDQDLPTGVNKCCCFHSRDFHARIRFVRNSGNRIQAGINGGRVGQLGRVGCGTMLDGRSGIPANTSSLFPAPGSGCLPVRLGNTQFRRHSPPHEIELSSRLHLRRIRPNISSLPPVTSLCNAWSECVPD